jgi:hypothetical protein
MSHDGKRRANKHYGDSPVRRSSVPIASSRLASSTRGTASRLPFGSAVESWPPQPSACPATQPPQLCRALMMQAASVGCASSSKVRCLVLGVAGKKLSEHLTERRSGVQLREDSQSTQPDTMDEQIAGWEVELHCDPA